MATHTLKDHLLTVASVKVLFLKICISFVCVCVCARMFACEWRCLRRPREGIRSPRAGMASVAADVSAGTEFRFSRRGASAQNS